MPTKNLSLNIVNGSDYVSPDPFNTNFEKLDALGLDYVVESGTSGEWWYRKWKSGRAQCGIDYKEFGEQTLTQWVYTSLYATNELSFGAYPFAFKSRPFTVVSFENDKLLAARDSWVNLSNSTSTTMSPSFRIVDASANPCSPACGIYVDGWYK